MIILVIYIPLLLLSLLIDITLLHIYNLSIFCIMNKISIKESNMASTAAAVKCLPFQNTIPQLWLLAKQRTWEAGIPRYIPQSGVNA